MYKLSHLNVLLVHLENKSICSILLRKRLFYVAQQRNYIV